jgi:phospholipid/cholesterol/gamma-HCH transport system substrate-binding protein
MMLTPLIRRQLVIFTVLAVGALLFTAVQYARVPRALGIGTSHVQVDFTDASGLYPSAIVTYRGVKIGEVSALDLKPQHAVATLEIDSDAKVPKDAIAELHSTSAIGEQYIDLVPADGHGPYLADGDTIGVAQSRAMPQISPVLDKLNGLLSSVPAESTRTLLSRTNTALSGSGDDVGDLVDSTGALVTEARAQLDATTGLIETLKPVLETQQDLSAHTVGYAAALAGLTGEVADDDGALRGLLAHAPSALARTDVLATRLRPALPDLLGDLATNAQVGNTYLPNIEQGLATYPALVSRLQSVLNPRAAYGDAKLDLRAAFNDPPPCIAGYLSPAQRRSPSVSTVRDVGSLYCTLDTPGPEGVRGARNYPCPNSDLRGPSSESCGLEFESPAQRASSGSTVFDLLDEGQPATTTTGGTGWFSLLLGPLDLK